MTIELLFRITNTQIYKDMEVKSRKEWEFSWAPPSQPHSALTFNFRSFKSLHKMCTLYRLFFGQPGNINSFRHVCLPVKKKSVKIAPGKQ